jgi:hypothetical protein
MVVERAMIASRQQASAFAMLLLLLLAPFAYGQSRTDPNAGKAWDPISGFDDGGSYPGKSSSGSKSPWSFPHALNSNLSDPNAPAGTLGGIVINGEGRRCGGMFRMTAC